MTRYRALRLMGCGWFTAGFIAALNEAFGVPKNEVRFMNVVIAIDDAAHPDHKDGGDHA
ncbi:hypothetical protein [Bordetella bronchiseptica]|uniref:Phage-related putative exported protein n=1 Tax=Bordetella bronchiseptica (strain ATCC BAA-588 / NCTC 13252 / RB50) TaxID=257310 RepID=A0A0H3LTI3_BORBR|nr:hypothetical protein [Bordetella bronchiseptica]KAK69218.1 hypothetical protein AZ22_1608 [Bordetella bronchiseptica 980-2]KDD50731.1 hypothetical protein L533_1756 [Bordetella bronchiseptica OSU553]KCV53210.1 hypothetical protein L491_1706 [Bordetella bronchiseptica 3E44]KCV63196.1 hypothetical protein AZ14_1688 [Bordetella bronchiseptica 980]KDB58499.1 hypothetical protein AZ15_1874 [Bordetella bronchiseptica A1-7]